MKPAQIALVERVVLVAALVGMTAAVAAFDWRIGLFFGSLLLALASLDVRWRRP